ncbi:unnamed protein product [Adineta steineri]|uniref:Uncharacterized protein n=2 Tax=Adineta steineri TaxID=433720 RepID=A0A818I1Q3_9BILA|nr:unnamed protein product [Adineta steineri]
MDPVTRFIWFGPELPGTSPNRQPDMVTSLLHRIPGVFPAGFARKWRISSETLPEICGILIQEPSSWYVNSMSHSFETSLSFLSPLLNKFETTQVDKNDNDLNQTTTLLPLSPLFDATVDDDYLAVQSLISKNYDVNAKDIDGITALHLCAFFNCVATCDTLCARQAFVNAKDNQLLTPLFYACKANCPIIVRTLVDHGADCDTQNKHWQTPLHICALSSDASSAAFFISHVRNVDATDEHGLTALHYACMSGNIEMVKLLIDSGANVNLSDRKQNYPLHWASYKGSIEIFKILLDAHVNVNCVNDQGLTPLHLCIINNHMDCIRKLLDANANINARTHNGSLPIHFVVYLGDTDIFDLLNNQPKAPELTETDQHGNTMLHFAAATKSTESNIIQLVLSKLKISLINIQNIKKQTPLHTAVLCNNEKAVHQLLAAGADPSLVDNEDNTPLHLSTILMNKCNQSRILLDLVSHQPDILCLKNKNNLIPLHIALKNFDYQTIGYLMPDKEGKLIEQAHNSLLLLDSFGRHSLHYAANSGMTTFIERYFKQMNKDIINLQDSFGLTPLHYACIKWHGLDAIDVLLRFGADVNIKCKTYGAIPLHYILVYCYSSDTIEQLIQAGSDVLISTSHGETCLSYGIMQNDTYLLKILFDSINDKIYDKSKLIFLSCLHGKDNSLEYLIENDKNINLDETMNDGMTALMLACYYGHCSCVHLLLHRKVNIKKVNDIDGKTSLHYAALNGQTECILALLQELQANQDDLKTIIDLRDKKGKTALHYCVEHSSPNCIRLLVNFGGGDPNVTDLSLLTPLHYCAMYNCEESLQELLDAHDLKVNVVDKNKRLPLHYAAASGNVTILSTLADYDYEQIADIDGFSPLHYAVLRGHETAVRILLASDVSLRCLKTSRITPVHLACIRADATCLRAILNVLRTDSISTIINLPTKVDQFTPLHLASMTKNGSECIQILLRYDHANVDAKDHLQRTPIMYAIINGIDSNIIDMLLAKCKHFDAVDHLKNNILHYACIFNNEPVIESLLRRNSSSAFVEAVNNENQTALSLAKKAQISPSIIDILFSLSGRL